MGKYTGIFFCDNCSAQRISTKHNIRLTRDGVEIIEDTCESCGVTQAIEINEDNKQIEKFRIKDKGDKNV